MHPGVRPPGPFLPRFMGPGRPPFAMRGMRLPMLMPPHLMQMPGAYYRYGGPTATSGPSFEKRPVSKSGRESQTRSEGPKPLMSIHTPGSVKSMVQAQQEQMQRGGGVMGLGMGPRYHLKRSTTSNGSHPLNDDEPRSKMVNSSRANLKLMTQPTSSSSCYDQQQPRQVRQHSQMMLCKEGEGIVF